MITSTIRRLALCLVAVLLCATAWQFCRAEPPTTQPAETAKTGNLDLTFTDRSPLSTPKSLAQRLNIKEADLGPDYDISKCPFKAYVPKNYDPTTPCGVLVYLGYKDTIATPPLWAPVLDQAHLIFIGPVCHSGNLFPPPVPIAQTTGLVMDAVYNLKRQYNIDDKRIYLMSWEMQSQIATADVFTGFVNVNDSGYYKRMMTPDKQRYYPPAFPPPSLSQIARSHSRPWFLVPIDNAVGIMGNTSKMAIMKSDGFSKIDTTPASLLGDLHYPNLTVPWFAEKALPFLDKATAQAVASDAPSTHPAAAAAATPAPSEAQHLLNIAQLMIGNGNKDLARKKLQQIIDDYPNDPAAAKAKQLLDGLDSQ